MVSVGSLSHTVTVNHSNPPYQSKLKMDTIQCDFPTTKPTITIDNTFREELLAVASTVTLVGPIEQPKLDPNLGALDLLCQDASPRFRLLELPNEILLGILERLDMDSLLILSQLSRRLHHLALPIYLARKGVSPFEGELVLFDEHSEDIVQALSIALFPRSLKRVYCSFNFYWPDRIVQKNVRQFLRLVANLDTLHEAHLDFPSIRHFGPRKIDLALERYGDSVTSADLAHLDVDWAEEFRLVFDAVLQKGCTTLTVCMSGLTKISTPEELAAVATRPVYFWWRGRRKFFQNILANATQTLARQPKPTAPYISNTSYSLSTLNLHSVMLLQAELLPWTIRLLTGSFISTLSLKNLDIHPDSWSIILPCIQLSSLSCFLVDLCSIRYPELANFLERHPSIQHLFLGRYLPAPSDLQPPISTKFLPNLTHLSATPSYLNYLLQQAGALPSLQSVVVIARLYHGHRIGDLGTVNNNLVHIAPRLFQRGNTYKDYPLTLELSLESSWTLPALDTRPTALMQHVSQLKLHIGQYRLPEIAVTRLPRWIGLFSSLREVHLFCPSQTGPTELDQRMKFVSSIFKSGSGLEKVGINGVVHDLDGWAVHSF